MLNKKLKIKKGDNVVILTGKDAGKQGVVDKVMASKGCVLVSGVNIAKVHKKRTKDSEGGILSKELPIDISNVAIVDPKEGKPTKVGYKFLEDGRKVRYAKLSNEILDA